MSEDVPFTVEDGVDSVNEVILFEDAERTKKVSNVQAIHFVGSSTETVTFSNLETDKTYYVGETDEFSVSMDVVSADEGVYAPVYPDDVYEITPTKNDTHKEYAFENMFYDLPVGYTYVGHLTVAKKC